MIKCRAQYKECFTRLIAMSELHEKARANLGVTKFVCFFSVSMYIWHAFDC